MFKYISSILAQFTSGQKIIALSLLLLSIVFVTLGPSLVNTITLDRDELTQDLKNKEVRIKKLESDIDTLSEKIRNNQMECTDQITLREKNFIRMLD
jgi:peptidoglycan hydrolase CwlO-like protein